MKLLFFARHWSYLRNFESVIEALAQRGHHVHMVVSVPETMGGQQMAERLVARYPQHLSMGEAPAVAGPWFDLGRRLRLSLDYLRYLEPRYEHTIQLNARAAERTPAVLLRLLQMPGLRTPFGRGLVARVLRVFERALPRVASVDAFISAQRPDMVLVTPLVELGSPQIDYLRSAKALGIRTVLPVCSWDHLSAKGLLRVIPDVVIVWNNAQRTEAIEMHGVPAHRVAVTGAQCYDQWWGRTPARPRQEFCEHVGLRADTPFILYVCSSLFRNTVDEPPFVVDWIRAVRSSPDPRLRDIGLLVRPHPTRLKDWESVDLSGFSNVAFFGDHPIDAQSKHDYFDSMYYSAAVVGLNTSAFIEASVVGRPVHTVLLPEISPTNQEGTIHFQYVLEGLLHGARAFEDHVRQLADTLLPEGVDDPRSRAFSETFVRPFGIGEQATPRFVGAIEQALAAPPPAPERPRVADAVLRLPLHAITALVIGRARLRLQSKRVRTRLRKNLTKVKREFVREVRRFVLRLAPTAKSEVPGVLPPSALTPKPGRYRDPAKRSWKWGGAEAEEVRELVTQLGRSRKPILVGPWLSETGFELLYWIPFVAWAKAYANLDPDKLIVVSRGGAAPWYSHLTSNYEELLTHYTPDQFRQRNEARVAAQDGRMKHLEVSDFDREIIDKVKVARGLHDVEILHPSAMYGLFEHFWFQRAPVTLIEMFTQFSALPPTPPFALRDQLPERYVVAKFYANSALPGTAENQAFVASFLADLAQHTDVVLLNTADRYDDHHDFPPELRGRIHRIDHLMRPENNLAIQTQVIRGAEAFVGTYGGFCYLAPLLGVDTLSFYSRPTTFRFDHLEVAKRVFSGLRCGAFVELETRAVKVVKVGFGGAGALIESVRR